MSEFDDFVGQMPKACHADLMSSDAASTAFYLARRAGWSTESLSGNAAFQFRRTGGLGVVISGMRTLAEHPPPAEKRVAPKKDPDRWNPEPRTALEPSNVPERIQVLHAAVDGTIDEPVTVMQDVIRRQRGE